MSDSQEMPTPRKPSSKGGDEVKVHSSLHHPLGGTVWRELPNGKSEGFDWKLMPGDNFIDRDLWKEICDLPGIVSRLDRRELRTDYESTIQDAELILAPAPRTYIRRLSAKATRIQDGQLYGNEGGKGASPRARLKALEAKVRELQQTG